MKSSSELFPVRLLSAELRDGLNEDVYLLKHNRDADQTVELALTHLSKDGALTRKPPVILIHGAFSNRLFWMNESSGGYAAELVEKGFDVWLFEWRAHGLSPVNKQFLNNDLHRLIAYDIPAVTDFLREKTQRAPKWIGHDIGGLAVLSSLAAGFLANEDVDNISVLYSPSHAVRLHLNHSLFSKASKWRWRSKGAIAGIKYGLGSENESYATIRDIVEWQSFNTNDRRSVKHYWQNLSKVDVPVFFLEAHTVSQVEGKRMAPVSLQSLIGLMRHERKCLQTILLDGEQFMQSTFLPNVTAYQEGLSYVTAWAKSEYSFCLKGHPIKADVHGCVTNCAS